ncbi:MAG TPA: cupin domain-containing protein [Blastocatellia bacterium]|nr:cupin domain-containing protein [Blastocatellia bacterium]
MTFGTTEGKPWVEALPAERGSMFTGRTFSRFHIVGDGGALPTVCEIWATSDHAVKSHAHGSSELLYVLSGAIEVNGRRLGANDVVFIPRGTSYSARVLTDGGSHVLRVELPDGDSNAGGSEYDARAWNGPLTADGYPELRGT